MKLILLAVCLAVASVASYARGGEDSLSRALAAQQKAIDSLHATMKYQHGTIALPDGVAKLNIPEGFKFLDAKQSGYVLHDLWGNPEQKDVLGMIFPKDAGPLTSESYAFIVTFDKLGYVKDEDADKINYDDLMKQIQEDEVEENKARKTEGYGAINMVGWASKPYYDKTNKVLHWAKNLHFEGQDENTLNYEVRLLGRKGVLSMNAVANMQELDMVKKDINQVLAIPSFTDGNTYKDFDSKTDNVAAWTIGGLVAGKVLLKAGLFAVIGKFLLAGWKFILFGLVAAGGFIKKMFTKKKEETVAVPVEVENSAI